MVNKILLQCYACSKGLFLRSRSENGRWAKLSFSFVESEFTLYKGARVVPLVVPIVRSTPHLSFSAIMASRYPRELGGLRSIRYL